MVGHSDLLAIELDSQVVVAGTRRGLEHGKPGERGGKRGRYGAGDRDAVGAAGLVDDVGAVARIEDVGVVAETAIEDVRARRAERYIVDVEILAGLPVAYGAEPDGRVRPDQGGGQCRHVGPAPVATESFQQNPGRTVPGFDSDILAAVEVIAFVVEAQRHRAQPRQIHGSRDDFVAGDVLVEAQSSLEDFDVAARRAAGVVGFGPGSAEAGAARVAVAEIVGDGDGGAARPTDQDVVAGAGIQGVAAAEPEHQVVARRAGERLAGVCADDQPERPVEELQALDVPELVGTVEGILDGMGHLHAAVGVARERIFGQ